MTRNFLKKKICKVNNDYLPKNIKLLIGLATHRNYIDKLNIYALQMHVY